MSFAAFALKHCPPVKRSPPKPKRRLEPGDRIYYSIGLDTPKRYGTFDRFDPYASSLRQVWAVWDDHGDIPLCAGLSICYLVDGTPLRDVIDALR